LKLKKKLIFNPNWKENTLFFEKIEKNTILIWKWKKKPSISIENEKIINFYQNWKKN